MKTSVLHLGSADLLPVRQIVSQFATGLFMQTVALLAVMPLFAWAELWRIGHKMAYNEYIGASH